jgi:hypothetical protein
MLGLVDIAHIPFGPIGTQYGFFTEGRVDYKIGNPEYEKIWNTIWKEIGEVHNLDLVDSIEEHTFKVIERAERERGLTFLKRALSQQALTPEQTAILTDLLVSSDVGLASGLDSGIASGIASSLASGIAPDSGVGQNDLTKPEVKPEVKPEASPELNQINSGIAQSSGAKPEAKLEAKPEASPDASPEAKPEPKLEVQKLETNQSNTILPETKTAIKTVDLNQAASLIQKRLRKTRRHRAATPLVHVTHKRVTAITHRKKRVL